LWASPRWLYGDCTSEIVNPDCANMSVKRLPGELAKLGEKTHQRRSKRLQLLLWVLRKRNHGGGLIRVRTLDVVRIDGRDYIEVGLA